MFEQLFEQLLLRPKPQPKELGAQFLLDVALEASTAQEQALIGIELGYGSQ